MGAGAGRIFRAGDSHSYPIFQRYLGMFPHNPPSPAGPIPRRPMSLNDLKISKKLMVGFAVVVTVVAAMCASVFMSLASIKTAVAQNDSEVAQLNASNEIITAL